ncbi:ATP-binding protein [Olsenella sp. An293]|uniref:ATP-binding protein n=1 Tax=Olsenella sp. An293 TaxID=1965626 RepID=UPI000B374705|nr:ATP-binding protein [Olsenella sp. An293]OUO33326.1 ATP-binding protein [Olsenella sp. An293]
MDEKNVTLSVPSEAGFARSVRMMASTLAVCCDMSVEDVEDVRMVAEEGFVYSCATAPERVDVSFSLSEDAMTMDFTLGEQEPSDDSIDLVEVLLSAVCDVFSVSEDGRSLHLVKRAGDAHDQ